MSSESVTQRSSLSFSIDNILREDFPPKSRLTFPPRQYYLPRTNQGISNSNVVTWRPLARTAAFWPYYYGYFMRLPLLQTMPHYTYSRTALDSEKQPNVETCLLDCNTSEEETGASATLDHDQDEKTDEQIASNTCEADDKDDDKELQSRKRRNRSQFTKMQLKYLEDYYSNNNSYLSRDERTVLAQALNMTELQIRNWFQNRRYQKKMKIQK